ncbi:MAG: glycosyltransferase [Elusimicrobia bacterium]|nr:glycosyltransferase [Elusimicrobiota bacterium]
MPKYSVIIPTYNRIGYLKKSVDSVLGQTYDDLELIVVDDGSSDGTERLIRGYEDVRLKYIYQENRGVSSARNRGLDESCGGYIAFLDSDDWWHRDKLMETEKAIARDPGFMVYHTKERWYMNGRHLNHKKKHEKKDGYIFPDCLRICSVSMSTAVMKDELFEEVGRFDEGLEVCEDYEFWLRVTAKHPVRLIDRELTLKNGGHEDQLSRRYWGMDRFRIRAICSLLDSGKLDGESYSLAASQLEEKCRIYAHGCLRRNRADEAGVYLSIMKKYAA